MRSPASHPRLEQFSFTSDSAGYGNLQLIDALEKRVEIRASLAVRFAVSALTLDAASVLYGRITTALAAEGGASLRREAPFTVLELLQYLSLRAALPQLP